MVTTAPSSKRTSRSGPSRTVSVREQRAEAIRFRRALTLVGLSVIAPGSAQLVAGNRRVGKSVLFFWACMVAVGGLLLWLVPLDDLARLALRPWLLNAFTLFAVGMALGWIAVICDAWRLGYPPGLSRRHRLVMVVSTLTVAALVATPLVASARYAVVARAAVVTLFPTGDAAATSDGRLNILLLGVDAAPGREGIRPDSITVVSVDVRSGRPLLISLPRNLEKARFPEGSEAAERFPTGFSGEGDRSEWLLNATWTYGEANPELFPGNAGAGVTAVEQAVEGTLGMPIHYHTIIDLFGFRDLVDALGGVTIRITEEIPVGQDGRVLEPGLRRLDGYETLWYARSRSESSDYARMGRQRCVLGAILHEADPATVLRNFTALAAASESVVTTNIPQAQLPDLVDMALTAKDLPLTTLQLVPPLITPSDPDLETIEEQIDLAIEASLGEPSATNPASAAAGSDTAQGVEDVPPTVTTDEPAGPAQSGAEAAVDLSSVCEYE
jgi:polyisoprenyl-teichoic acid--peptidoglycan teichoic acid transferase